MEGGGDVWLVAGTRESVDGRKVKVKNESKGVKMKRDVLRTHGRSFALGHYILISPHRFHITHETIFIPTSE